jgi:signal transduction histidine kinase
VTESRAALTADQLVKVAFLVRLISLAVALGGLVGEPLTLNIYFAVLLMALASYLGLAVPRARELLVRHPMLAMTDVALVVWVVVLLGVGSPLVLAAVSTALLVGMLYPLPFALLPAAVLVLAHGGEAWAEQRAGADVAFVPGIGMSAILAMLVLVGQAVRQIQAAERRALAELATEREVAAADAERNRLAREMHDGVAKSLQGIALTAAGLPLWVERDGDRAKAEARMLADGAGRAVDEARTLLSRLRLDPAEECAGQQVAGQQFAGQELGAAVEQACAGWAAATGRHVEVDVTPVPPVSSAARRELVTALGEALENVSRHAPLARVLVRLEADGAGLRLEVADDGPGFTPSILAGREAAGHFGVRGMAERMASVAGTATVESAPGAGTRVVLVIAARPAPGARHRQPAERRPAVR